MQEGVSPNGSHYFPAFPYTSYSKMTRRDLKLLKTYIFSLPPIEKGNKGHKLLFPANIRWLQSLWKTFFFDRRRLRYIETRGSQWNRGSYLVNAVTHCGECHTPRNIFGGIKIASYLAGTRRGPNMEQIPNITPDMKTGIGRWSSENIVDLLKFGLLPDGDIVGGSMADVVENLSVLNTNDMQAIVAYINSIPSISNRIGNN